ncbi:hypothetical protein PanWU01x14_022640 [Parasponia andersonii]|uniref:Uncharacterized protein n=1 Tax=Parasponia andersonii TaxID=3476 RepID=A0A2P5DXB3_PARAD|nr:hypothetical protein PanWU01x14_022640 [Parasponia andersonii]
MAILKNYKNILQKLNHGYDIKDRDDTRMGKRDKEIEETKIISEEKLKRSVDNVDEGEEEIKKKLEEEEQRQFIATDIKDIKKEAGYDTSPMFSTQDVAKVFRSTGDVDKAVKISTSYFEGHIVEDNKAIYDETPIVFKGYDKLDICNIPAHLDVGENIGLKKVLTNNPHEYVEEKVAEKPMTEIGHKYMTEEDEHDELVTTKIPNQHSKEKVKKVS